MTIETHPLTPFLPKDGRVLFLGSFPPPKNRWSMEFFYPNWINDFWRIMGLLFYNDSRHFEVSGEKRFDKERIETFCEEKGFGFFDTAIRICRKRDNASDNFLEILEPTDVASLLRHMPECRVLVTTGGKASEELASTIGMTVIPEVGGCMDIVVDGRHMTWWRMPSSSRAFPMSLEKKANAYKVLMNI